MINKERADWLLWNLRLLQRLFGERNVMMELPEKRYIYIQQFPLPSNWKQLHTPLMIVFDNPANIFVTPPDRFYIAKGLRNINGETPTHYFAGPGFNDLSKEGWARYSFHIKGKWKPSPIAANGSSLVLLLDALHKSMTQAGNLEE